MKAGQLSVETLLVLLVFVALLGIAYLAASRIGAGAQNKIGYALSQNSFSEFSAELAEACSLGSGNVRQIEIKGGAASLSLGGSRNLLFSTREFSSGFNSACNITLLQPGPSRFFTITNSQGEIEIS